jgi:hypothetical protein
MRLPAAVPSLRQRPRFDTPQAAELNRVKPLIAEPGYVGAPLKVAARTGVTSASVW